MREGEKFRVELVGKFVRLEPLGLDHALGLLAAADEEAFGLMPTRPDQWDTGGFRHYVERLTRMANHQAFAVLAKDTGRVIGSTSYADIRQEHRGVEIGYTWLTSDARGGAANPEMKRLMLAHVFENPVFPKGPAIRVTLKTDRLNERSQRAIEKLGAAKEGVLRQHIVMPDGRYRDTVMYSIIDTEWPALRDGLDERLAAFG